MVIFQQVISTSGLFRDKKVFDSAYVYPYLTHANIFSLGYLENTMSTAHQIHHRLLDELQRKITVSNRNQPKMMVYAPFDRTPIGQIFKCDHTDVEAAVKRGRIAQKEWEKIPVRSRATVFLSFIRLLRDQQQEILDLVQLETGKARKSAFEEVADVMNTTRHYVYHSGWKLMPKLRRGVLPTLTWTWEVRHPVGVVGMIAPWNYPLTLAITDAVPAMIAGNAVVLKPAEQTSFTALWVKKVLEEAGVPPDLFQVVTGTGAQAGMAVAELSDFVQFTGSTATGRKVAQVAAKRLVGSSMELGGKNSMLVLSDANLRKTAKGAVNACFSNAGQLCISAERIFVHQSLYEEFLRQFTARIRKMKLGPGYSYKKDMGSLIGRMQYNKVRDHILDAKKKGAGVVVGGRPRPDLGPYFVEPTVLTRVTPRMNLYYEETFGPVVAVFPFRSVDEAIEQINDTQYGLNASIWTRDTRFARKLAERIKTGTVNINEGYAAAWGSVDAPMGGFKASGLGRRHGREGLQKFTEPQTISIQTLIPVGGPSWLCAKSYAKIMSKALGLLEKIPFVR